MHEWRLVSFTLCVGGFVVKYVSKENADPLMAALSKSYKISREWEEKCYLGLDLDWDYNMQEVHLSMLAYVIDALDRFSHKKT